MKKFSAVLLAGVLSMTACKNLPSTVSTFTGNGGVASATSTVADATAAYQSLTTVVSQVKASGKLSADQITSLTAGMSKVDTDMAAVLKATGNGAAGTVATVLDDIVKVAQVIAPFVPTILTVVAALGQKVPPAPVVAGAMMAPVKVDPAAAATFGQSVLKLHAELGAAG